MRRLGFAATSGILTAPMLVLATTAALAQAPAPAAPAPVATAPAATSPTTNAAAIKRARDGDRAIGTTTTRYSKRKRLGPGGQDAPAAPVAHANQAAGAATAGTAAAAAPTTPAMECRAGCYDAKLAAPAASVAPAAPAASPVAMPKAQATAFACVAGCDGGGVTGTEARHVNTQGQMGEAKKPASGEWMTRINRERQAPGPAR